MLQVFYGNDTVTVRSKAFDVLTQLEKKGASVRHIDQEQYVPGIFTDLAHGVSLFADAMVYLIDTPSTKQEMFDDVMKHVSAFAQSDTTFIIIEEALLAAPKKQLTKHAHTIEEIKASKAERFNAFGMADSLARKDKKTLWLQLQQARAQDLSSEEIIGVLWWQLKSLRLAQCTTNAEEAGMKDFPYNKAKRALASFAEGELETLAHDLLTIYHQGHAGEVDLDLSLEHWVLTL